MTVSLLEKAINISKSEEFKVMVKCEPGLYTKGLLFVIMPAR